MNKNLLEKLINPRNRATETVPTVIFDTKPSNLTNSYNNVTEVFTAPETGKYRFT
jgi:hypothetical protein